MTLQVQARRSASARRTDRSGPWSILLLADALFERKPSTTTRLGMPFVVPEVDDLVRGAERVTGAPFSWGRQFWQTYVSSTATGITYSSPPRPVREDVQKLRDEIARRTRLDPPADRSCHRCRPSVAQRLGQGRDNAKH